MRTDDTGNNKTNQTAIIMMQASEFLQKKYDAAVIVAANGNQAESTLPDSIRHPLNVIIDNSESSKAVMTVVFTSAVYKCLHPQQDIRRHQSSIKGGYAGRTFDANYYS